MARNPADIITQCADGGELPRLALFATDLDHFNAPPEWVELIPSGDPLVALDGRRFQNPDPQAIVDAFAEDPRDIPIDWEHSSEHKARNGDEAPAAGWVVALEVREGAVWGRVKWTDRGAKSLASKEYRYISPVFSYDTKAKRPVKLHSAGLTNQPAFHLQVMAAQYEDASPETPADPPSPTAGASSAHKELGMNPKLLAMLGLAEDATEDDVLNAVTEMKGEGAQTDQKLEEVTAELEAAQAKVVDLTKFVPRSEYDKQVERASAAEQKIAAAAQATHAEAAEAAVDAAVEAGKVVPANRDFYLASCHDAEGLARFKEFVEAAPVIAQDTDLDKKQPDATSEVKLTDEQREICTRCGLTEEQFINSIKGDA